MIHFGCGCCELSRRHVLQAGFAAAAVGALGTVGDAVAQADRPLSPKINSARVIDTHAHYFPKAFLEVFNAEGRRFDAEFHTTDQGFFSRRRARRAVRCR